MSFNGRNTAKISNRPSGGGNKLQGLTSTTDKRSSSIRAIQNRSWGENRNIVFCMNQLGGIGRHKSQFNTSADGILDCEPTEGGTGDGNNTNQGVNNRKYYYFMPEGADAIVLLENPIKNGEISIKVRVQENNGFYCNFSSSEDVDEWDWIKSIAFINRNYYNIELTEDRIDVDYEMNEILFYLDLNKTPEFEYKVKLFGTNAPYYQIHYINNKQVQASTFNLKEGIKGINLYSSSYSIEYNLSPMSNFKINSIKCIDTTNDQPTIIKSFEANDYVDKDPLDFFTEWYQGSLEDSKIISEDELLSPFPNEANVQILKNTITYHIAYHYVSPNDLPFGKDEEGELNIKLRNQTDILNTAFRTTGESMLPKIPDSNYTAGDTQINIQFEILKNPISESNYYSLIRVDPESDWLNPNESYIYNNGLTEHHSMSGVSISGDTVNIFIIPYDGGSSSGYAHFMKTAYFSNNFKKYWAAYMMTANLPETNENDLKGSNGKVLVHEIGHMFNLMHTFGRDENSYLGITDGVLDTPLSTMPYDFGAQYLKDNGEPYDDKDDTRLLDTVPNQPGKDPVYNFMNYTAEINWRQFTDDQAAKMWAAIHDYQPMIWLNATQNNINSNINSKFNRNLKIKNRLNIDKKLNIDLNIKFTNKNNNKVEHLFTSDGGKCGCKHLNKNFDFSQLNNEENKAINNYINSQKRNNNTVEAFKKELKNKK